MINIIAGGKKNTGWCLEAITEYQKRLKKPYDITWHFLSEEKLANYLASWPFSGHDYVILLDERGQNISSPELSQKLEQAFNASKEVVFIIGGAYGVDQFTRDHADFIWSFSKLVFPHLLARVMTVEQIYRAQEISRGGKYHHL